MIKRNPGIVFPLFFLLAATLSLVSCGGGGGSNPVLFAATATGTVQYEDKEYGPAGFTGATPYFKPSRFVLVEIVDTATGLALARGTTDSTGAYRIPFFYSLKSVYVRVISEAVLSGSHTIEVRNLSNKLHAIASGTSSVSPGETINTDMSIAFSSGLPAGAFNILDVYASGFAFVKELSGTYPPALTAYWQDGNIYGTYYLSGWGIFLLGGDGAGGGDTDEYDDDVLWHEFGHFVADSFSKDDSPGGAHSLVDNDLDLRLSWSEGWGDFFPAAVKSWVNPALLSTAGMLPSQYVDTLDNSAQISFDFGSPPDGDPIIDPTGDSFKYSSSEVAVAKVLWDLQETYTVNDAWDIFITLRTAASPINFERFWDDWLLRPTSGSEMPALQTILTGRSILYQDDAFENDDSANAGRAFTFGLPETHTLYPNGDADYVAFSAVGGLPYTIQTSDLKNGADTYLTILDTDGSTVLKTDNNNATSFSPAGAGTYYVKINTSPNTFSPITSKGRYGTYSLTITQP